MFSIMELRHYMHIAHPRERQRLAQESGTTVGYLYQVAGGHRRPGAALALRVERATRGAVCRCRLRPDLFSPEQCAQVGHPHGQPTAHCATPLGPYLYPRCVMTSHKPVVSSDQVGKVQF